MGIATGASGHTVSLLAVTVVLVLECSTGEEAAFKISLELQGGNCSDHLTLICRHSPVPTDPNWIHNGTAGSGQTFAPAFPGLTMYSFQNSTEHRVTVTGVDDVAAMDGYVIQCGYGLQSTPIKSNAVKYSFVPEGFKPTLSKFTANSSEHLSTFTYSFQESCSLYPRCIPYFSVNHTVSPLSVVSTTSSGCTVEYSITNLTRCQRYESTATILLGNQKGNTIVVGNTIMLSPGRFTIIGVTIGVDHDCINVTIVQDEPDCPGSPTEWYTVDIDGVQVANITADKFQSLTTKHNNGSVTLSLPLTQRLSEEAVTVNMTKFNTVPTNMSDDMGNIVTEMVTWETSAVFGIRTTTTDHEPPTVLHSDNAGGTSGGVLLLCGGGTGTVTVVIIIFFIKKKKQKDQRQHRETTTYAAAGDLDLTPTQDEKLVDVGRPLPMLPEDNQLEEAESGTLQPLHQYAELDFSDHVRRPIAAPPNENFDVKYTVISET